MATTKRAGSGGPAGRRSLFNDTLLPLLVFPPVFAAAAKYIFAPITETDFGPSLVASCAVGKPYSLPYTSWPALDAQLCILVSFFQASMEPASLPYTTALVYNLAPIPVFCLLEAARPGRSIVLSSAVATAVGLAYQKYTGGITLPLYWALFVLTRQHTSTARVEKRYARATLFALLAGFLAPSAAMVRFRSARTTALWQGFPLWMLLAQRLFLLVGPRAAGPGTGIVREAYGLAFVASAWAYLASVWPLRGDVAALKELLVPRVLAGSAGVSDALAAKVFLQWDGAFIALGAQLATLWFARSAAELLGLVAWNVVVGTLLGPGAALASIYAWREGRMK